MKYEKGNASSLQAVGEAFLEFAQTSNATTQAWELIDDRINSLYGATLRVPIKKSESFTPEVYYVVGNDTLTTNSGTYYLDTLKTKYPNDEFVEDFTMSGLDDVLSYLDTITPTKKGTLIFNGFESDIASGKSVSAILSTLDAIDSKAKSLGLVAKPFITPTLEMYTNTAIEEKYKVLRRVFRLSGKMTIVCLGDSITDETTPEDIGLSPFSWTWACQEDIPYINVINKGVKGDTTSSALARFQTDVLEQHPNFCFMLIGGNDLWYATETSFEQTKANYENMIQQCLSNNIIPIIGTYVPTLEQVMSWFQNVTQSVEILSYFCDFCDFCSSMAKKYNLLLVENIYKNCRDNENKIILDCTLNPPQDKVHMSKKGAEIVGHYIASSIKSMIDSTRLNSLNCVDFYDIFCSSIGIDELSQGDLLNLLNSDNVTYNQTAQDYIDSFISDKNLLGHIEHPYFYISFQHTLVDSNTYANWLRTTMTVPHPGANTIGYQSETYDRRTRVGDANRYVIGKYGSVNRENAFCNNGSFLAVGLHTLYDRDLWMCEQGSITCEKEAYKQTNDINMLPWRSYYIPDLGKHYEGEEVHLPVFPSTGCPWFVISEQNKIDFEVSKWGIDYWFTKSDYDATITLRFRGGLDEDVYQSMSFGMMSNVNEEAYIFPLYVAGGSQALKQDIYVYTPVGGKYPTYKIGNIYDLDMQNICLSNSNLLNPTKFNGANMSNFRILSPEGEWKDIYAHSQGAYVVAEPTCDPPPRDWKYLLSDVVHGGFDISEHSAYIFLDNNTKMTDTYRVNHEPNGYEHSSRLENIIVALTNQKPHTERCFCGTIPNCYGSWYKTLPVGEIEINGKKYLSLPNVWKDRWWNYPAFYGKYTDSVYWENTQIRKTYDRKKHNDIMYHRLLIPLGGGD